MKDDFFDLVFDKMEDENAFDIKDAELNRLRRESSRMSDKLYKFINKRVHPKSRRELISFIERKKGIIYDYYTRENKIYYKSGFLQGMYIVILMYYEKNNKKDNWISYYYSIYHI